MFISPQDEITDEAVAAALIDFDFSFKVPEPSLVASMAADWVKNPSEMVEEFTAQVNRLLEHFRADFTGDLLYVLQEQYCGNTTVLYLVIDWQNHIRAMEILNLSGRYLAFPVQVMKDLQTALWTGLRDRDWKPFTQVISQFSGALQRLVESIEVERLIALPDGGSSKFEEELSSTKSATLDDFKKAEAELKANEQSPTNIAIMKKIRSYGLTIGSSQFQRLKRSAVRPPESAD